MIALIATVSTAAVTAVMVMVVVLAAYAIVQFVHAGVVIVAAALVMPAWPTAIVSAAAQVPAAGSVKVHGPTSMRVVDVAPMESAIEPVAATAAALAG